MKTRAFLFLFAALVLGACSGDAETETSGSGGSSANSSSGTGSGTTCADCTDTQHCVTCNYPGGSTHSCVNNVEATATTFNCGEGTLCDTGSQVCTTTQSIGDGCGTSYKCNFFPSACDATPTCECILMYEPYQQSTCMDFGNGEFWISM